MALNGMQMSLAEIQKLNAGSWFSERFKGMPRRFSVVVYMRRHNMASTHDRLLERVD
jgi:hypothetical protein